MVCGLKLIVLFGILTLSACQESLLHGLDELRANRVLVALADAGIQAKKKQAGSLWDVQVSNSDTTHALKVLEAHRLLRRDLGRAATKESSLIKTREERKIFLERHLAWSIEHTLEAIPQVLEARVHLCMHVANDMRLREKEKPQSASVLIVHGEDSTIDLSQVKQIISGAAGIDEKSITVIASVRKGPQLDLDVAIGDAAEPKALSYKTIVAWFLFLLGGAVLVAALLRPRIPQRSEGEVRDRMQQSKEGLRSNLSLEQAAAAPQMMSAGDGGAQNGSALSVGGFEL
jgi:type III secretory pathway lipoprotein EscJ